MSSPFTMACRKGHLDVVKALAGDKRVELNFRNKYGMTGFYRAREKGNERVVEYLLTLKGIDVNRADECEGWTPLIAASFNGHVGVVQHLLANCERLTDVRYKDFEGLIDFIIYLFIYLFIFFLLMALIFFSCCVVINEGFTALDNAKKGGESKLRKENCSKVVTLLTSFEANQKQIRNDLRKQLGYLGLIYI